MTLLSPPGLTGGSWRLAEYSIEFLLVKFIMDCRIEPGNDSSFD